MNYDYVIIGGGPSGVYCADKLSEMNYKVCLLEELEDIGGCHRVRYVSDYDGNMIHTEHGPRIYLGAYLDFWKWMKTIGIEKDKHFTKYITKTLGEDIFEYSLKFKIHELLCMVIVYLIQNIVRYDFSVNYTVDDFMKQTHFTKEGKERLNRICRLIDGGNTDKTTVSALFKGLDTGLAYYIYEPTSPMNKLVWSKLRKKLQNQSVDIYLDTRVRKITKGVVYTEKGDIKCNRILLCIPPMAMNNIENAPSLVGYDVCIFDRLSQYQQYEPYICATIHFKGTTTVTKWGIAGEHPWGLVDIDMGRYFKDIYGSMFIVSVTHPEKVDPHTNLSANQMDRDMFLDRIVEIVQERFDIQEHPIAKTLSPNVKKVNGQWIETDRAFMYSPPGWLKPDIKVSSKNGVWTTGHHIGDSHHEYNSMESAVQNAIQLLRNIEPGYDVTTTEPWRVSDFVWISIIVGSVVYVYYSSKK